MFSQSVEGIWQGLKVATNIGEALNKACSALEESNHTLEGISGAWRAVAATAHPPTGLYDKRLALERHTCVWYLPHEVARRSLLTTQGGSSDE